MSDVLGVIGRPITGSAGQFVFNRVFEACGIDAVYLSIDLAPEVLPRFLGKAVHNFRALNVTSPHKLGVFSACNSLDETARETGSVNLVVPEHETLSGFNTDVAGFSQLLKRTGINVEGRTVTVLGTGGAARSVIYSLRNVFNPEKIIVASREPNRREGLRNLGASAVIPYSDIPSDTALIVSCTPASADFGLSDQNLDEIQCRTAIDLVYGKNESHFSEKLKQRKWTVYDGSNMYIGQALETLRIVYGNQAEDLGSLFEQFYAEFMELR